MSAPALASGASALASIPARFSTSFRQRMIFFTVSAIGSPSFFDHPYHRADDSGKFTLRGKARRIGVRLIGGQFEIDLTAECVDSRDPDPDIVAEAEFSAVAASFDDVFFFIIVIIVVG